jgi:Interferon-induced transmembrane protein
MSYGAPPPPPPYGAMPAGPPPMGPPPQNNLVWAILSTVLCCLPLGVVSIVFAAQVNGKWAQGDFAGAQESAKKAKQFAIWSAIAWVVVIALYVVFFVLLGIASNSNGG